MVEKTLSAEEQLQQHILDLL